MVVTGATDEGGEERTVLTLPFQVVGHRTSKQAESLFRCHLIQPLNFINEEAEVQRGKGSQDESRPVPFLELGSAGK